ncbi:HNH endonuclease, partial [Gordonia sp. NPDC003950]
LLLGADATTTSTIRRLYVRPADGTLVSMDARSRCFPKNLAHFISLRDQRCRVPYCDAPVEEIEHADPHRHGGATTATNGDGTCSDHNHSKEADGWTYTVLATTDGPHTLDIRTPTGHTYRSIAPPLIRPQPPAPQPARPHPPIRRRPRRTTHNRTITRRRRRSPI